MQIIRAQEQTIAPREKDNREVRSYFNNAVEPFDWLMVTNSHAQPGNDNPVGVGHHRHPDVLELIIFNKPGKLEINGEMHHFDVNDVVLLDPSDFHGATDLKSHDCTCILLSKGKAPTSVKN